MNDKPVTREMLTKALDEYLGSLAARREHITGPIQVGSCTASPEGRIEVEFLVGPVYDETDGGEA